MSSFEQAVTELFHQRFGSLFRYLDRLTGDPDLANDLAQEAFVRLYKRGDMPDDPHGWLAAVATNLFRDTYRTDRRRGVLMKEYAVDVKPGSAPPSADDALVTEESRAIVRNVLDALPERDRELLLLREEGFSYRELARKCGVAETSVGTLLIRATRSFRTAFAKLANTSNAALD